MELKDTVEYEHENLSLGYSIKDYVMEANNVEKPISYKKLIRKYFTDFGGWPRLFLLLFVMVFWLVTNLGQNLYIAYWITSEKPNSFFHFTIYIILAALYGIFEFIRLYIIY